MRAVIAGVALALFLAAPALANSEDIANDVARNVMSPYCEGVTLHDCPSREALELRGRIATWADQGMTKGQIIDRLVSEFGPQIRAVPQTSGTGLFAWVLPGAALIAGIGAAVVLARRFSGRQPPAPTEGITSEQRARLDAELEAFGGPS
ncbi:MAG: cytochrome c-type biosis protein CcmH [Actinomycetota bacterium]|jgi:cytochrome c-type biogenesis protein CcmH|nr:cytochrome c-type biosis protein CcmH [Actinomycetota bacterium]